MNRLVIAAAGIIVIALLALGCAASDSDSASADTPITKKQFINRANAVCAKSKKEREAEVDAWEKKAAAGDKEVDFGLALKKVIGPSLRQEAEELEALPPPAQNAGKYERWIALLLRGSKILEEEGAKGIERFRVEEVERRAIALGIKNCAKL